MSVYWRSTSSNAKGIQSVSSHYVHFHIVLQALGTEDLKSEHNQVSFVEARYICNPAKLIMNDCIIVFDEGEN